MDEKNKNSEIFTREAQRMVDDYIIKVKTELSNADLSPDEINNVIQEIQNHILELCRIKNKDRVITTDEVASVLKKLGSPEDLSRSTIASRTNINSSYNIQTELNLPSTINNFQEIDRNDSVYQSVPIQSSIFAEYSEKLEITSKKFVDFFNNLASYPMFFALWFILPSYVIMPLSDTYSTRINIFRFVIGRIFTLFLIIETILISIYVINWFLYTISPIKRTYFDNAIILHKFPYFTLLVLILLPIFLTEPYYFYDNGPIMILLWLILLIVLLFIILVEVKYFIFKNRPLLI